MNTVTGVQPPVLVEDLLALLLVVAVHDAVAANPQLALLHVGLDRSGVRVDADGLDAHEVADGLAHPPMKGDAGHRRAGERDVGRPTREARDLPELAIGERGVVAHRLHERGPAGDHRRLLGLHDVERRGPGSKRSMHSTVMPAWMAAPRMSVPPIQKNGKMHRILVSSASAPRAAPNQ